MGIDWHSKATRRWLIAAAVVIFVCGMIRPFGPYSGKVVDAETGEPIEGAVVHLSFDTTGYYFYVLGEPQSKYVDAAEVVTDKEGEFLIPRQILWAFRFLHLWDPHCMATVFKAGYAHFPGYMGAKAVFTPNKMAPVPSYSIPPKEHVLIKLPKLRSREERISDLRSLPPGSVPDRKMRSLLKAMNAERVRLGYEPVHQGRDQ